MTGITLLTVSFLLFSGQRKMDKTYGRWMGLFVLFCSLSLLWSLSVSTSINVLGQMIRIYALTFFVLLYVQSYKDMITVMLAFYVTSIIFLVFLFSVIDVSLLGDDRFAHSIGDEEIAEKFNSNYIAGQFVIAIYSGYFLFWKMMERNDIYRLLYIAISLAMLYVVFVSGSRTSLEILIIPLVIFNIRKKNFAKGTVIAVVTTLALYWVVMKIPEFYEILGTRIEDALNIIIGNNQGTEDDSRIQLIKFGWNHFFDRPILGYGINCFRILSNESYLFGGRNYYAHNNYIELLVDIGFIGAFIYYYFAHWKLFKSYQSLKGFKVRRILLTLLLVSVFTDLSWVGYYNLLSQLILCMAFAIVKIEKTNKNYAIHRCGKVGQLV